MSGVDLSPLAFEEKARGFFVHFTDGTVATIDDLVEKLKGRSADQIAKIELYPNGGGRLDGERGNAKIRGQSFMVEELPFPINVIMPLEVAMQVGRQMADPAETAASLWTPGQ